MKIKYLPIAGIAGIGMAFGTLDDTVEPRDEDGLPLTLPTRVPGGAKDLGFFFFAPFCVGASTSISSLGITAT